MIRLYRGWLLLGLGLIAVAVVGVAAGTGERFACVLVAACSAQADAAPADAEYVTVEPGTGFAALLEDAKLVDDDGCLMFEGPADSETNDKRFTAAFPSTARMEGDTVRTNGGLSFTVGEVASVPGGMLPDDPLGLEVTVPDVCAGTAPIWSVSD